MAGAQRRVEGTLSLGSAVPGLQPKRRLGGNDGMAIGGTPLEVSGPVDRLEAAQLQGLAEEVQTGLPQSLEGKELLVEQVASQSAEVGAVLHRG